MHELIEDIQEENQWRQNEFASFKHCPDQVDSELWDRMCIPMIYAHWEGVVVNSLKILIGYLNTLNLSPNDVATRFIVFGLDKSYNSLSGKQSFVQKVAFTDKFKELFQQVLKFKKDVNTKSNLNSKVLKELCDIFGFNFNSFADVAGDIDRIVTYRNRIAHGESSIIPESESIEKYIATITTATDILFAEIDNFICNESYRLQTA